MRSGYLRFRLKCSSHCLGTAMTSMTLCKATTAGSGTSAATVEGMAGNFQNITPSLPSDVGSDRQKQRQMLNKDFRDLAKVAMEATKTIISGEKTGSLSTSDALIVATTLSSLVDQMRAAYKKYPLLCRRGMREAKIEECSASEGADQAIAERKLPGKKKKLCNRKKHQIKKGVCREDFLKLKSSEEEDGQSEGRDDCIRALAIGYNRVTQKIFYGLSGQYKKQKIHREIWGKSLLKGRPRGTCAEFKVVNQSLWAEEKVSDLTLQVVDIMTGDAKPRCRNCLYITQNSICLTDDLVFDGNMTKQLR